MPRHEILLLGGTRNARILAERLQARLHGVTYSLAGATLQPALPSVPFRIGRFNHPSDLVNTLSHHPYTLIIDATHPFAQLISHHAEEASTHTRIPLLKLHFLPWESQTGDQWHYASSLDSAITMIPTETRLLATLGRRAAPAFLTRTDIHCLLRTIHTPIQPQPPHITILNDRPPFPLQKEIDTFHRHRISLLLTRDMGGDRPTKLDAARQLSRPVILIRQPSQSSRLPRYRIASNINDMIRLVETMPLP